MVTPTTSLCDADVKEKNLVGGTSVCKYREKPRTKTSFFPPGALWWPKKLLPLALSSSFVGHRELPELREHEVGVG